MCGLLGVVLVERFFRHVRRSNFSLLVVVAKLIQLAVNFGELVIQLRLSFGEIPRIEDLAMEFLFSPKCLFGSMCLLVFPVRKEAAES